MRESATQLTFPRFTQPAMKVAKPPAINFQVVSLFSGCGGLDLGFRGGFQFQNQYYDTLPYDIVWANDCNKAACNAYKTNLRHDIRIGALADVMETLPKKADIVMGGFPCQDVSINGAKTCADGKRTVLYKEMIEVLQRVRPCAFVAENVKGLLQSHGREFFAEMLKDFEETGYKVTYQLYLAADFGVPQMRERVFIVGTKRNFFKHPQPKYGSDSYVTTKDAIGDLETELENSEFSHIWSKAAKSPEQGSRYLKANKPSTTIRAEHHGNVQWHYSLARRISLRESARLQSFPDEFIFPSAMRETERQIGNAVPPVLAWHIAKSLCEHLTS